MNREQVLMSLGYPVAGETPDLSATTWTYFFRAEDQKYWVLFDDAGLVQSLRGDESSLAVVAPAMLSPERRREALAGELPCSLNLYRPNAKHWNTSRVSPFVYVDGEMMGTLGLGDSLCLRLSPGSHKLSLREKVGGFIPSVFTKDYPVTLASEGAPVFLRYTKEFAGMSLVGGAAVLQEDNQVQESTEARWRARD